jgi:hypothetical protein
MGARVLALRAASDYSTGLLPMSPKRHVRRIPKGRRVDVRRDEFDKLVDILNYRGELLNALLREQRIQFERIAQLQAEMDRLKREVERLK